MGMILQFRQSGQSSRSGQHARAGLNHPESRSAEIIIFPGVRIERQQEPDAPSSEPSTPKRAKRTARRKV